MSFLIWSQKEVSKISGVYFNRTTPFALWVERFTFRHSHPRKCDQRSLRHEAQRNASRTHQVTTYSDSVRREIHSKKTGILSNLSRSLLFRFKVQSDLRLKELHAGRYCANHSVFSFLPWRSAATWRNITVVRRKHVCSARRFMAAVLVFRFRHYWVKHTSRKAFPFWLLPRWHVTASGL